MSTTTTNLGLVKPEMTDAADITAMNGNWDKIDANIQNSITHIASTNNPHSVTKSQVGLGNVDNTSDLNKPISTAMQTALNNKQTVETITDIDSFVPTTDGVKIGVYITDDAIDFGTYYVIALRYDNVVRQIVFSCDSNRIKQRTKTDEQTTWRAWTNPAISVSSQNTYTLSSYNASVNYTFSSYTTHADVKIISCTNNGTSSCVGTMCDIANNKIWFFKPQGVSSEATLNITYRVIEF